MIPKGSQRGGGQQLATHLLNEFDNDRVELAHVRGSIARDLHGVFAEWRAISRATQCRKYLYSLSLNPDPKQKTLTRAQYIDFINRTEKQLGLDEQPRIVVFHVKHGREHCHVVWSRIDERTMKAVQLSYDHQSLRTVARAFAREHGLRLPLSMQKNRGAERYKDRQKRENLVEQQQEERSGISKAERIAAITQAWRESKTGKDLIAALEKRGYLLARGDQRGYVVVDRAGEIHSLAREIEGARTKDVKARLAGYPVEKLPDAHKAQDFLRAKLRQHQAREAKEQQGASLDRQRRSPKERREELAGRQEQRRAALTSQKDEMEAAHGAERDLLLKAQKLETLGVKQAREKAKPGSALAFLMRITGFGRIVETRRQRQDAQRTLEHRLQREKLERRHEREAVDFRHREHALSSVEARERRSLETQLRRETFERASGRDRSAGREGRGGRPPPRRLREEFTGAASTREQARRDRRIALLDAFDRSAQDGFWTGLIGAPRRAARWLRGVLTRLFNHSDRQQDAHRADLRAPKIVEKLRAVFAGVASRTPALTRRVSRQELIDAFRRSAGSDLHARRRSGTATQAPEKPARTAYGPIDTEGEILCGTLSRPFNDSLKQPERSRDMPAPEKPEGLSGAFTDVASRTGADEKREMREDVLAAFRHCAGRDAAQRSRPTERSGPPPASRDAKDPPPTRAPAAGADAAPSPAP
jgi:hypothetical protein